MRVFIAGHRGMVGSALCRRLAAESDIEILVRDRKQLDLNDDPSVNAFFREEKPDGVNFAAPRDCLQTTRRR